MELRRVFAKHDGELALTNKRAAVKEQNQSRNDSYRGNRQQMRGRFFLREIEIKERNPNCPKLKLEKAIISIGRTFDFFKDEKYRHELSEARTCSQGCKKQEFHYY
ncbi:hypothetical protein D3C87_1348400 [compost metagenome]